MKNFTLLAAAAVMAVSATAAPVRIPERHKAQPLKQRTEKLSETRVNALRASGKTLFDASKLSRHASRKATRAQEPSIVPPITTEIVTEQPAGQLSNWSRNCQGYSLFWGYVFDDEVVGSCQQIVEGEDGKIWFNYLLSQFPLPNSWAYAEKDEDGGFTIPCGQLVYQEYYEGEIYNFYLVPMKVDFGEEITWETYASAKFNYVDGKYVEEDPEIVLGLCEYDGPEDGYYWTAYGDYNITFEPMTAQMAEIPEGLATEKWAALTEDSGYFTEVGIDGDTMYIKGLVYGNDDGVMAGTINGNEVTFPAGQFVGADPYGCWTFVYGGEMEEVWDDYWEEYYYVGTITGDLVFNYDAEAKKLTDKNVLIVANNYSDDYEEVTPMGFINPLTVAYQNRNPEAAPMNPEDVMFFDEMADYGSNTLQFTIPEFDVDGNLLDSDNLYYRLYTDGDIFTFYDDEYPDLPENGLEMLNVRFTNFEDIWSSGWDKTIYLYFEGVDTIGVQSVYLQPVEGGEPVELCSEIVTVDASGVRQVAASETVATEWFDLLGRRVSKPAKGLSIRVDVKADGTRNAVKTIR